jgi:hypothetical protein
VSRLRPALFLRGQWGLGDNIYARAFVRELAKINTVYLETPWPELYCDLDVRFVRGDRRLRTQMKNVARQPADRWVARPPCEMRIINYTGRELPRQSIPQALSVCFGIAPRWQTWDLPDWGLQCPVETDKPIAVVRPVTLRTEWLNSARNPHPEYIAQIATELMATHRVVSVADIDHGEFILGNLPPAHVRFIRGELAVRELLTLVRHADVVIGGVGWIVPAAIALKVKCFVILGGHGAHNSPQVVTDPAMDLSHIAFAKPERFCLCSNMRHDCDKTISDLRQQWQSFLAKVANTQVASPGSMLPELVTTP